MVDRPGGHPGIQPWHDSAVARGHFVAGDDRRRLGPAITLEYLLDMLTEHRVETDLR